MNRQIPQDSTARAEEFLASYNRIDDFLRRKTGLTDRTKAFGDVLREFIRKNPAYGQVKSQVERLANLRNVLVHDGRQARQFFGYPSELALLALWKIEEGLLTPETVLSVANREVETLSPRTPLMEMLVLMREENYSQFPVYADNGGFAGLATSNGVSRWFAHVLSAEQSLIDINEHVVDEILGTEEQDENCEFVAVVRPALEALFLFRENPLLEAVLVTEDGSRLNRPVGILTRWDAVRTVFDVA